MLMMPSRQSYATFTMQRSSTCAPPGQGIVLAKFDLHQAYRILPVHPDDHLFLAVKWQAETFIDTALPFRLRLATKIFSAFADALTWVLRARGVNQQLHYLDDFLSARITGMCPCITSGPCNLQSAGGTNISQQD